MTNSEYTVIIPFFNEEKTLEKVIQDFILELPQAEIIVFDNGSEDSSLQIARKNNIRIVKVKNKGKGHVIREMFNIFDGDILIMVDSDDTYDSKDIKTSTEEFAEIAKTLNLSWSISITSNVFTPMLPVEPKITKFSFIFKL